MLAPNSGVQPPICNKVDDTQNDFLRINAKKAQQAAADYCTSLASNGVVLSADSDSPKPGIVAGAAEKNRQLALTVEFDVDGCPADKSSSTVDFTKMSADECLQSFFTAISEACMCPPPSPYEHSLKRKLTIIFLGAQDSTWSNYDPNFTLEGGVFLNDCGLFGMTGEP